MLLLPVRTRRNLDNDASPRRIDDDDVDNGGSIIVADDDEAQPPPRPPQQRSRAAPPCSSSGCCHVPILIGRRRIATLVFVFRRGGQICAASASLDHIRREVMCANGTYLRALVGAASSLARSTSAKVGAQWQCSVSQRQRAARGGERERILRPVFFADQAASLGA